MSEADRFTEREQHLFLSLREVAKACGVDEHELTALVREMAKTTSKIDAELARLGITRTLEKLQEASNAP